MLSCSYLAELMFNEIFGGASSGSSSNQPLTIATPKTLKLVQDSVKASVEQSYDAIGLLLSIRINMQHILIMQKRKIPCLDLFFNSLPYRRNKPQNKHNTVARYVKLRH